MNTTMLHRRRLEQAHHVHKARRGIKEALILGVMIMKEQSVYGITMKNLVLKHIIAPISYQPNQNGNKGKTNETSKQSIDTVSIAFNQTLPEWRRWLLWKLLIARVLVVALLAQLLTKSGDAIEEDEDWWWSLVEILLVKSQSWLTKVAKGNKASPGSENVLPANLLVVEEVVSVLVSNNVSNVSPADVESRQGGDSGGIGPEGLSVVSMGSRVWAVGSLTSGRLTLE
jgi:hypothetical protein